MMLVDLAIVKQHLKMDADYADELIVLKIEQAGEIIADYLKVDVEQWDPDSSESVPLPGPVSAALLLVVEALFDGEEPLSTTVKSLLHRLRDPALA